MMEAWVITDGNDMPIGIRETEQDVMAVAETIAKRHVADDDEHSPEEAETVILVPEFDGDCLTVRVYLKASRHTNIPYMLINAEKFDSTWEMR